MKTKEISIMVLVLVIVIQAVLLFKAPKNNEDYWKQRTIAAEDVIYRVYEDQDVYVMDVLSEGCEWDRWCEIASQQGSLE